MGGRGEGERRRVGDSPHPLPCCARLRRRERVGLPACCVPDSSGRALPLPICALWGGLWGLHFVPTLRSPELAPAAPHLARGRRRRVPVRPRPPPRPPGPPRGSAPLRWAPGGPRAARAPRCRGCGVGARLLYGPGGGFLLCHSEAALAAAAGVRAAGAGGGEKKGGFSFSIRAAAAAASHQLRLIACPWIPFSSATL